MSSINFNPFSGNWFPFSKPPNPLPLPPLNTLFNLSQSPSHFASTSLSTTTTTTTATTTAITDEENQPGPFTRMVQQFFYECEHLPDHRHTPQVEKILNENDAFDSNPTATEQEMNENQEFMETMRNNPVIQFLMRAEAIADDVHETEMRKNQEPYRKEDRDVWKNVPNVMGLDGRPMPRKSQLSRSVAHDKFWDFARQFYLGIWGFWQRPYPSGKPIDAAQAIGYKKLEKRYYDFIMRSGVWFYKDRLGRTRGPLALHTLKTAWGGGIIDKNTFIWGEDMDEWAPIHMIYGMERAIATWEVRLAASATALYHKLQKGIPPWVPLKGFEQKSYKQLQEEAVESKRRDLAVMEANDGIWPGVRTPSHALFLWASGSEMTPTLERDHMPNKYIPKDLRQQLAKLIPGLRPWEVLSLEQAMDRITFNGKWYRETLGSYNTGPPFLKRWNRDVMGQFRYFDAATSQANDELMEGLPGYEKIYIKVMQDFKTRVAEMKKKMKREARLEKKLPKEKRPKY